MSTRKQANNEQSLDDNALVRPSPFRRAIAWITLIAYIGQPLVVTAEVIADQAAAANNRPLVDVTANGLPLVQIAPPSAAGVSHNQYTQFNVGPAGVILNNSQESVLTQQAGYVGANPNLVNGSARIILNEVTSTSRSQLNGYTEVAGQQAEVIIANPNGITCNGCGFINASRGVLTTGAPVMGVGGSLDYFRVTGGDIQIGAAGMNASNTSQLDIITRSVQVNGELWANNLNVITGANRVNYNTLGVQLIPGTGAQPTVGIDVALLGGMYANKIRLIGTEAGVGVNSLGNLSAQAGDFTLDNAGQITLGGNTTAIGSITTPGNIAIHSDTSINNYGILYSQQDALLTSTGGISNAGLLTAGGNLTLEADSLNSTGTLGSGIDVYGNASQFGNLEIITQNQTAATGSNIAGDSMSIRASEINLTNSNTNAWTGITLTATAGNINNTNGLIVNALDGNGNISLTASNGSLINADGRIGSDQNLTIIANALTGSGKAIAGNDVSITLQSDYTNAATNVLFANRNLLFNTSGNFTNQTALEAQGRLTVSAANIFNQAGGSFNATQTILTTNGLTTTGDITNDGRIDGSVIAVTASNFTNNASIIGDYVTITANNLTNQSNSAIIGATTNIDLWITNQLGNFDGAEIYSMGDLNIAANNAMDANGNYTGLTQRIVNEGSSLTKSSLIEADGNINIGAAIIDNQRPTIIPTDVVRSVVTRSLTTPTNYTNTSYFSWNRPYTAADAPIQGGFFTQDMVGLNFTTQSFNVVGNESYSNAPTVYYENISSTSYAAVQYSSTSTDWNGNLVRTTQVINASDIASSTTNWVWGGGYTVRLNNGTVLSFDALDKQGQYYNVSYYPGFNPNVNIHPSQIQTSSSGATETSRSAITTTTDQVVNLALQPREAQIRASGNININLGPTGELNNYVSTIAAGGDITINDIKTSKTSTSTGIVPNSSSVTNTAFQLNRTVSTVGTSNMVRYYECGSWWWPDTCSEGSTIPSPEISHSTALSTIPSAITAGGSLVVHTEVATNTTIGGAQTANPADSDIPEVITLPSSGLYTINPAPDQDYLVVTDSRFTNYQSFISSDYMLERLTLDPQYTQRRLGDGFYEQKLINDQVTQLTGRRFIAPYANAQDEIKALMDSGIAAAKELKLVTGLTLTKEQVAALTMDILWMVEEKVTLPNGDMTKVLVPKVYLTSLHTADLKPNGALIAADVIDINATGMLANSGRIKGNTAVMLAANDIFNKNGTISSLGELTLNAGNDIRNESGMIRGRSVQLSAGRDILNSTLTQTIKYGDASFGASNTLVLDTGTISATENLSMNAENNITISGANVEAGGNATLNAGGNLTVDTIVEEATATVANSNFHYDTKQITNHTSAIKTGGSLTLVSGNDMRLTSATVEVGKEAMLVAGGDLTIDATKDSYRMSQTTTGEDNFYAAEKRYDERVLAGSINSGGNITLIATQLNAAATTNPDGSGSNDSNTAGRTDGKGNITLQSANITSKNGTIAVAADGNVNIGVTEEEHTTYTELHTESSGFTTTTRRTKRDETWRTDTIGSSLSGDSISISSGKDINIEGSAVEAEHNIDVGAMGSVNIVAATDTYGSEHYSHEITTGWQVKDAFNITNKGPEITSKARTDGTNQSENRSSLTSKKGNLNIMAGGDLVVLGSDLAAGTEADKLWRTPLTGDEGGMASIQAEPTDSSSAKLKSGKGEQDSGKINLTAGGTVAMLAGQDTLSQSSSTLIVTNPNLFTKIRRTITDTFDSLDYSGSTVQGDSVKINAGRDIMLQATDVKAGLGGIELEAGNDILLLAAANTRSSSHQEKLSTDGFTFRADGSLNDTDTRRMNNKFESQTVTNQVTSLVTSGNIKTRSGRDTRIEASTLEAGGAIDLSAGTEATYNEDGSIKTEAVKGDITFAAIKDSSYYSVEDSSNSMPWQSSSGHGEMKETLKLANIKAGTLRQAQGERGGLTVNATGEIIVDIPEVPAEAPAPVELEVVEVEEPMPTHGADGKPLSKEELDAIVAERAAKAAEKAAEKAAKAIRVAEEKRIRDEQRFTDHIQNLASKPGQEWIGQLALMAKDKPDSVKLQQVNAALQHWDYAHEGLTGEASAVIAIVVTYFTAGAGSAVVGTAATTTAVVTTAVVQAAITTLATQATLSLINNKGNVGKTLDDMGKSENVKALVTSMITAGILSGLSQTMTIADGKTSLSSINAKSDFMDILQKNVINNTASTVVNHAINGGDLQQMLEQSLKNALIDTGAATAANWIGDQKQDKTFNNVTHKLAHALAGCALGAAKANDCSSGALGAVVGEITAELYSPDSTAGMSQEQIAEMKTNTINFSKLMAGVAAALTGGDAAAINLAAAAAGNAVENNRLLHQEESEALAKAKEGKSDRERHELDAAACALAHCADGVPPSDPNYEKLQALQQEGERYKDTQQALVQTGAFSYSGYTRRDAANDFLAKHDEGMTRTIGGVRVVGGAVGTVGGGAMAAGGAAACGGTLISCALVPVGLGLSTISYGDMLDGNKQLTGAYNSTEGQRVLDSFDPSTYPGERDRVTELGLEGLMGLAEFGVGKFGFKVFDKVFGGNTKLSYSTTEKVEASQYFGQQRNYWSQEPIQFSGNKVYQRNDLISPDLVDPKTGMTNLELMQAGRAPIGPDGRPVNLHHMLQSQDGPIAEVTQSFHQGNSATIHINSGSDIPSGIDRSDFNKWRSDYWMSRANDFKR